MGAVNRGTFTPDTEMRRAVYAALDKKNRDALRRMHAAK